MQLTNFGICIKIKFEHVFTFAVNAYIGVLHPVYIDESSSRAIISRTGKFAPSKYRESLQHKTNTLSLKHKEESALQMVEENNDNTVLTG